MVQDRTAQHMNKLKPIILRKSKPLKKELGKIKRNPIYFVLDSIIDTYNIGSLFRLADAVGVKKLYICGDSEYPPSSRIHKAAVGTENWVPWEKKESTVSVLSDLKKKAFRLFAWSRIKVPLSIEISTVLSASPLQLWSAMRPAGFQRSIGPCRYYS